MVTLAVNSQRHAPRERGTITGLSYRNISAFQGEDVLDVYTSNKGFDGNGSETCHLVTDDGWEVNWHRRDLGIVTGEDFLPAEWWDLPWKVVEDDN